MLTNTIVEICSTPLTTASRRPFDLIAMINMTSYNVMASLLCSVYKHWPVLHNDIYIYKGPSIKYVRSQGEEVKPKAYVLYKIDLFPYSKSVQGREGVKKHRNLCVRTLWMTPNIDVTIFISENEAIALETPKNNDI